MRALALAQHLDVAVLVGQHLELDVARPLDELLQVDVGAAESRRRLLLRLDEQAGQFLRRAHDAHAAPAAAGRRLEDHRVADLSGHVQRASSARCRTPSEPGSIGTPVAFMTARARSFNPIRRITSGGGPDELDAGDLAHFGEIGVLAQEAVAGVDGVHVGDLGGADDRRDVQIAQRALGRTDADGLVGEAHVQAVAVGLRVDGDGPDAQVLAGADDAEGDLAAVGDQNLLEHACDQAGRMANSASPYSTGWAFWTKLADDGAGDLGLDLVHQLHGFDDAQHLAGLDDVALHGRTAAHPAKALRRMCPRWAT